MTVEKENDLVEFIEIFLQLDPLSRLLVQSGAKLLLTREQAEKLEKAGKKEELKK